MENTKQTQTKPAGALATASSTLKTIQEGSNKKLLGLIPKGQSPKLYIDLIKGQIMRKDKTGKDRSDEDLLMFLYVCKRVGLDPLTKQIYAVFRWDYSQGREIMTIQTGIDGMRLVAQRTNQYAGQDDIKFTPEDESTKYPTKATCTIYKMVNGEKVAFTASARWSEYVQKDKNGNPNTMWEKMPYNQLGKCAEALALRKGFPNELSGIYATEEMGQADNILSKLPTPERHNKDEVEMIHGAPDDNKKDVVISNPEAKVATDEIKVIEPKAVELTRENAKSKLSELRAKISEQQQLPIDAQNK